MPLFCAWNEALPRSLTLPRGIPIPAESLRIVNLLPLPIASFTGPRLTKTVCPGAAGGRGITNCLGAFTTRGIGDQPDQTLPACHAHPNPGTKVQAPYRYGIQP